MMAAMNSARKGLELYPPSKKGVWFAQCAKGECLDIIHSYAVLDIPG